MCRKLKNPKAIQLQRKVVPLCCLPASLSGLYVACNSNLNLSHIAMITMIVINICCITAALCCLRWARKIEKAAA